MRMKEKSENNNHRECRKKGACVAPFCWYDISIYRDQIYGFSILWIMLFHANAILGLNYTLGGQKILIPLNEFLLRGNIGVESFLFCSGICLYFSWQKSQDIRSFITRRFKRLFWPVFILNTGYWIWKCVICEGSILRFVGKMSLLDFWVTGDQQIWFISLILVCYVLYPYIYAFLHEGREDRRALRTVVMLSVIVLATLAFSVLSPVQYRSIEIAFTRLPVFCLGCLAGKYVYEKKELSCVIYLLAVAVVLTGMIVLHLDILRGPWKRWCYLPVGIGMVIILTGLFKCLHLKWLEKFLAFFGKISLNLYVAHVLVLRLYRLTPWYTHCRLWHYAVILMISVVLAYLTEKIIQMAGKKHG